MSIATLSTVADYARIFEAERQNEYPVIDAFEERMGYEINRLTLEQAARMLACPVKKNPPNWQHGRVIYAAVRNWLAQKPRNGVGMLDIGTAKGFSALCLHWALEDHDVPGSVSSCDVLDPDARIARNTLADVDGLQTLGEILEPWIGTADLSESPVKFVKATGIQMLSAMKGFWYGVCFIDGKHSADVVLKEGRLLHARQEVGDLAIFDDLQLIGDAVDRLEKDGLYAFERLWAKKDRGYAVGVRRG